MTSDFLMACRGLLMGGADIIPGVSGGTIALILGIYERLVTAISRVDMTLLGHLRSARWRDAAEYLDLRFLVALGIGIAAGIAGLASVMHWLLLNRMEYTFGAFFGLILASSILVGRMVAQWNIRTMTALVAGCAFAYWLVGLKALQQPPDSLGYVLLCGMVAICAMILPGISGAFILLIMGMYADITGVLRQLLHGDITLEAVQIVAVFAVGAAVGLIGFSKILRVLLARFPAVTLAVLAGFMLGSLRKIWPYKHALNPEEPKFKLREFDNLLPDFSTGTTWLVLGCAVAGAALVFVIDRIAGPGKARENRGATSDPA